MKRFLLLLGLFLSVSLASAQTTTFEGYILSASDSTAVVGATVMAEGGIPNTMVGIDGKFSLQGVRNGDVRLEVNFLGFETLSMALNARGRTIDLGKLYLRESDMAIGEVVVTADAPIAIQKGDTTQFNASAFKTNPDADADELLMKIPGVVIQDGVIEAQGEPVRRIYVDGRLFFGTDPMAALKNLPADAIESIQLFDDPSDQARFTGFDDGETQKAINIVTKAKTNETLIVKAEASAGLDTDNDKDFRYLAGGNISYFKDDHRFTVTGLSNNVNTMKFGQNDPDGSGVDENGNPLNQQSGIRKINGLGANYSLDRNDVKFSGDYFYDENTNTTYRHSRVSYFPTSKYDSREVTNDMYNRTKTVNHRLNMRLEWKINRRNTLVISPRINVRDQETIRTDSIYTIQDNDPYNRSKRNMPSEINNYSFSGFALWTHRFEKRGRALSANFSYSVTGRDYDRYQEYEYRQNYKPNQGGWVDSNTDNQSNDQNTTGNNVRLKLTFSEPLGERHRLLLTAIGNRDWGSDTKLLEKYTQQGDYIGKDLTNSSDFTRDYNSLGGGVGYSYRNENYRFSTGLDYLRQEQTRDQLEPIEVYTSRGFDDIQPMAMLRYTMDKSRYLRFNYRGRTIIPRIDYMQDVIDTSNPSNVSFGNPDLKQGYQHNLTLFYNSTNTSKSTNFTLRLEGRTISNYVAQSVEVMPSDRDTTIVYNGEEYTLEQGAFLRTYTNLNGYIYTQSEATYSFAWRAIKSNINITGSYGYVRNPSIYTELNYANIHSGGFRLGVTSNISEKIDFNFYSNTNFNHTANSTKENSSFLNQNIYLSTNIIFLGDFVFNSLFSWRYYTSGGVSNNEDTFYTWNAGVGKKIFRSKNGEIRVTAYDILNQNRNLLNYVRTNNTEYASTNTLGRYVLARLSYRFNSMTHGKAAQRRRIATESGQNLDVNDFKNLNKNN